MASLSVKFQSSVCTLISFRHDWKIRFAMAEYPPLSLLIFGLHSLWNSCAAIFISYPGGYAAGLWLAWGLHSSEYFLGVDVNPPEGQKQNAYGAADCAMPMWLLLPAHSQNVPFQWPEYLGKFQWCALNLQLIWHLPYQVVYWIPLFAVPQYVKWDFEEQAFLASYSAAPGLSPG